MVDTETPDFAVHLEASPAAVVVVVRGEVDLAVEREYRGALQSAVASTSGGVVVDLCGCTFMDSRGLVALLKAWMFAGQERVPFAVACVPGEACGRLFALAVDGVLETHPDRSSALAAVRSAG